jgi:hypothetical protein
MSKRILFITVVSLIVSTTAFAFQSGGGIAQVQTTCLSVEGAVHGSGGSYGTSYGTVSANQSASTGNYRGYFGSGSYKTADQSATSTIATTGVSTSWWGSVCTWVSGFANTWQGQVVW